jgi:hypothetical protein
MSPHPTTLHILTIGEDQGLGVQPYGDNMLNKAIQAQVEEHEHKIGVRQCCVVLGMGNIPLTPNLPPLLTNAPVDEQIGHQNMVEKQ